MKWKKVWLILLTISSLFNSFGEVHYFSIDSLPGLYAVDLDSNKVVHLSGRVQYGFPYDSNSYDYNPDFDADLAFSFGNLDPSCSGQLFLTYFQSYHVPDIKTIDTSILVKRPRVDTISKGDGFAPYYELNNFYTHESGYPNLVNEFFLIKTNKNNFALLRINALLPMYFDYSLLCEVKDAIKLEWWIQDDGKYDELSQVVAINRFRKEVNRSKSIENNNLSRFDLVGRKIDNPASPSFMIIKNQNNIYRKNHYLFHSYRAER